METRNTPKESESLAATSENIYEVVAMLRPDLCLVPKRVIDGAIALLVQARHPSTEPSQG